MPALAAAARFGGFFLRDFDFGIGDGLLDRRRQLYGSSLLRRHTLPIHVNLGGVTTPTFLPRSI